MDGSSFDTLTRLVGEASTRRHAMRSALTGAAAAAVAAVGLAGLAGDAEAKRKKKKKKKKCPKCKPFAASSPCSTNKQCCTNETNRICAVASNAGNGDTTCCGGTGATCTSNDNCCANYSCSGGFCST